MPAHLSVQNLSKKYGPVLAIDTVSFAIESGITGLLGPNGAGKSTLFQILTGLFAQGGGHYEICGINPTSYPARALSNIGVVFQQSSLDLELTVAQNLSYYGGLRGLGGKRLSQAIDDALGLFGLAGESQTSVRKLSGGTRRKVELARALLDRPPVLLLDEPTVGLDPASRAELVAHIRGITRERRLCVLWATHLVEEVAEADAIIVLHQGRVLAQGTPADIIKQAGAQRLEQAFLTMTQAKAA